METTTPRRKGRGCLIALVVLLLLVAAWWATMHFGLLEKLGLRQPASERVFAPPPDREAAAALTDMLQQGGMNTEGVSVYVLPMAGKDGSVAIFSLDASNGFDPERWFGDGGDADALERLFEGGVLQDLGVTRLAFDYTDRQGNSIVTLTAPTEALNELANEQIDEKQFFRAVKGRIDIPGLIREVGR